MSAYTKNHRGLLLVLFIVVGIFSGALLTGLLSLIMPKIPYLTESVRLLTIPQVSLDLDIISFSFGLELSLNLVTVVCLIIALLFYRRY